MALTATIRTFTLDIADVDRGVYAQTEQRVAQHPSESVPYMIARVLAFALAYADDLEFGRGVSTAGEPALYQRDPTGRWLHWIEIGAPAADLLHRASKLADQVTVYTHRAPDDVTRRLTGQTIHRAAEIAIHHLPASLVDPLVEAVGRRNSWSVVRSGGVVYVTGDGVAAEGAPVTAWIEG